jgi:hypothetical protein
MKLFLAEVAVWDAKIARLIDDHAREDTLCDAPSRITPGHIRRPLQLSQVLFRVEEQFDHSFHEFVRRISGKVAYHQFFGEQPADVAELE